jgi:hypothetical protein
MLELVLELFHEILRAERDDGTNHALGDVLELACVQACLSECAQALGKTKKGN